MELETQTETNVQQAVPFFAVNDMERSLHFYLDGLGFTMRHKWMPDGKIRWCWIQLGDAALMLQEFYREGPDSWAPEGKMGVGVSIYFICRDALALYREFLSRGIKAQRPFVGNRMWVTQVADPDGYKLC